jgi:SAM-dependent methyltransferase
MTNSPEEQAQRERFEAFYLRSQTPVMLSIERSVCGCDYGGNSWTTMAEAQRLAALLGLRPGLRLLDLGAGSGWPGLFLAETSGCDVVLADLPMAGLRIAVERATNDSISGSVWAAVADAAALPFEDGAFDAIGHSDLLCCLKQKRAVLAACRSAIRPHGRMAFTVISVAPGLSAGEHRRAVANGPEFIETATGYPALLAQTGWTLTGHEDVTKDYAASCRRQLDADVAHEADLVALIGASEFAERLAGWRPKLAALGDNILRREIFVAVPGPE